MSPIVKRKGEKFTLPSKYLLLIITILCVGMMVLTFTTDVFSGPLSFAAGYVVVPFQEGITAVGTWMSEKSDELGQIRVLLEENKELKRQVDELTVENTMLQQDKYELNHLRELYQLDDEYSEYQKVGARIIGWDGGNWFHSFTINKGSDDGLEVDMNVMAGGGLVGRIVSVGSNWAKVTAIIDDNSNVSGMVLSTSDNLIVSGDLELMSQGMIRFGQLVDSDNEVAEGDKIVTSNISDKYLPGILIGYISTMEMDSNNLTKSGRVIPAVDFAHLEEVLVILEKKQSPE
ncbi:MAG: rod shape-determining protein MreC [Lachnospiraceae bacterium]|nr:rod shape-determining protein MreC [Lachnospiraceae bacterium]MDD7147037.1 rod shape-determining protein MreC [Lachnospiraceae bacterium]MDY4068939.1 rod shape-determining protein MreC [Lachnospiraceae bacterium]